MGRVRILATLLLATTAVLSQAQPKGGILIAAASDLKFALDSIAMVFKKNNPVAVRITYGSSGKLYEQISNGAPFDIFFSADIVYPTQLKDKGLGYSDIYAYGVGRIVLWSSRVDPRHDEMMALLLPSVKKIAIANPAHAPYGKRAEESLTYYKLMERVEQKLVFGENISQTAQFVTTGAADMGIVALSLALSPAMKKLNGNYYLIPEISHQPLVQGCIITRHGAENQYARAFYEFVKSKEAVAILHHFGFTKS